MSDSLGLIFGSNARVKIMRLFLFNEVEQFTLNDIKKRSGVSETIARRELNLLNRAGFIKKKIFVRILKQKRRGELVDIKKKYNGFIFNDRFSYVNQMKQILIDTVPLRNESLVRRFNKAGRVKLIVTSGIFIHNLESRLDILIVGDRLNRQAVDKTIQSIENEIGRELKYAVFDTGDFSYRMSVYDRLVRDVLDYPHLKILDRMNVSEN